MAVRFINALTGCDMWVDGNRVDEYLRMGHEIAPSDKKVEEEPKPTKPKTTRKKKGA